MKNMRATVTLLCLLTFLCPPAVAQGGDAAQARHFSVKGLSFDYPSDASLEDMSGERGQHLVLKAGAKGAQIMIISRFDTLNSQEQFETAHREVADKFINAMTEELKKLGQIERTTVQIEIAGAQAPGVRLRSVLSSEPGDAECYSLLLGKRLVLVTLIGSDKEIAAAANTWAMVRRSLRITPAETSSAAFARNAAHTTN
ncbi:MAG: hypothetical protein ACJ741_16935 [Pyrinomonadaceae bacterium]